MKVPTVINGLKCEEKEEYPMLVLRDKIKLDFEVVVSYNEGITVHIL